MKKETKFKKNRSGFIEVPTYQFPQNEEYADEIVDFEEYAKRKAGGPFVEYLDEKLYIFYENKIKAVLRPMVHVFKSALGNLKEKNQSRAR